MTQTDLEDILLWPDGVWCYRYELKDITHKSNDYEVLYFDSEKYDDFINQEKQQTIQQRLLAQAKELDWFISTDNAQELLKEAASHIDELEKTIGEMDDIILRLERRLNAEEQLRENFS